MVVARGGVPLPVRPLSPSASRIAFRGLGMPGRADEVARRVRRTVEVMNFILCLLSCRDFDGGVTMEIRSNGVRR